MSHSTSSEKYSHIDKEEHDNLSALLKVKLQAIPSYHIPTLAFSDVLAQTPRASHIPNIPPDLQLAFFLRNRDVIDHYGGKPVKEEGEQSLDTTRAIWFWRLDEARQFQRFHYTMRWNTTIFIELLASDKAKESSNHGNDSELESASQRGRHSTFAPRGRDIYVPPAARRFIKQYLTAIIEHHNTPIVFSAREAFISTWKNSAWNVYTAFEPAQKKLLKNLMKKLTKKWEVELDIAEHELGREAYEQRVAQFVGCLVSGRKYQGVPAATLPPGNGPVSEEGSSDADMADTSPLSCHMEGNELLDALRTPFTPKSKHEKAESGRVKTGSENEEDVMMVTDLRTAIEAVQRMRPRDILPMLMRLFADLQGESKCSVYRVMRHAMVNGIHLKGEALDLNARV